MQTHTKPTTDATLSVIAGLMGAKGGKARTAKKVKASRANVRKALAARGIKLRSA